MGFKPPKNCYMLGIVITELHLLVGLFLWLRLGRGLTLGREEIILKFENFIIFSRNIQIHPIFVCAIYYTKIFFNLDTKKMLKQ